MICKARDIFEKAAKVAFDETRHTDFTQNPQWIAAQKAVNRHLDTCETCHRAYWDSEEASAAQRADWEAEQRNERALAFGSGWLNVSEDYARGL